MRSTDINNFLKEYIAEPTSGSLLIDGEWGIGKTYFINDFVKEFEKEQNNFKIIKISLFGITSIEELSNKINTSLLTKIGKVVDTGKNLLGELFESKLGIDISIIDFGSLLSATNKDKNKTYKCILIFDDLERCSIDIKEILGYINNLNENYEQKVVVIANVAELKDREANFRTYKEKVFSFIFNFEPDFENSALNILKTKFSGFSVLQGHQDDIVATFQSKKHTNLRTVINLSNKINRLVPKPYKKC
ncbi:hypothetical protein Hs30E_10900 [Lactococcus hodotermopsidis]|uniref:KAP NTPase domain-containing protein n=1 Tax=Pseudolactococcus hodotermopsidis TaxID=2709157 RepID=A0A6A0BAU4_9LACT|nr:P-loop NTPase fold protein [Lactococcus hodotermopsidis]GFH42539.1 hypothetical protein Hs30E_10900 [Lactococcus hodotermopsidis]